MKMISISNKQRRIILKAIANYEALYDVELDNTSFWLSYSIKKKDLLIELNNLKEKLIEI